MKAQELRIGNLYYYHIEDSMDDRKEWDEVNRIDVFDLVHLSKHPDDSDYRPIPLTEEILLKAGFEKHRNSGMPGGDHNAYYYYGPISLTIDFELGSSNHNYDCQSVDGARKLEYLHELQNLYYALTHEKLEVKL
jgi:hypothetical protein